MTSSDWGGESADIGARKKMARGRRQAALVFSDDVRSVRDQERTPAHVHGERVNRSYWSPGQDRRPGLDPGRAGLGRAGRTKGVSRAPPFRNL